MEADALDLLNIAENAYCDWMWDLPWISDCGDGTAKGIAEKTLRNMVRPIIQNMINTFAAKNRDAFATIISQAFDKVIVATIAMDEFVDSDSFDANLWFYGLPPSDIHFAPNLSDKQIVDEAVNIVLQPEVEALPPDFTEADRPSIDIEKVTERAATWIAYQFHSRGQSYSVASRAIGHMLSRLRIRQEDQVGIRERALLAAYGLEKIGGYKWLEDRIGQSKLHALDDFVDALRSLKDAINKTERVEEPKLKATANLEKLNKIAEHIYKNPNDANNEQLARIINNTSPKAFSGKYGKILRNAGFTCSLGINAAYSPPKNCSLQEAKKRLKDAVAKK